MSVLKQYRAWLGTIIHSINFEEIEIIKDGALVVDQSGTIVDLFKSYDKKKLKSQFSLEDQDITQLSSTQLLIPGFIDCHTHAPQYPNLGVGLELPLLEWLEKYTFPTERTMGDLNTAIKVYEGFVDRLIKNGTTAACYFATVHLEATKALADIINSRGQRAWVGKVNMDIHSPSYLCETTSESLENTENFILHVQQPHFKSRGLVEPAITPRFALTCSVELLKGLGALADKYNVPVQSHLCESIQEIAIAKERFPEFLNYTDIYMGCGLITNRTMMAHCIHMEEDELEMICQKNSSIAHCASSNFNLCSGVMDADRYIKAGIKLGLGTDVSGGTSPSILHALRSTLTASRVLQINKGGVDPALKINNAFYLATMGGAEAMGLSEKIGNFSIGKQFDALLVQTDSFFSDPTLRFHNFLMNGDDRNILKVYVQGSQIHPI